MIVNEKPSEDARLILGNGIFCWFMYCCKKTKIQLLPWTSLPQLMSEGVGKALCRLSCLGIPSEIKFVGEIKLSSFTHISAGPMQAPQFTLVFSVTHTRDQTSVSSISHLLCSPGSCSSWARRYRCHWAPCWGREVPSGRCSGKSSGGVFCSSCWES